MKKSHLLTQLFIFIGFITMTPGIVGENESPESIEESGQTIRTGLKTGWLIAKSAQKQEAVDTIAKAIDTFGLLYTNYKKVVTLQAVSQQQTQASIASLQSTITGLQQQLAKTSTASTAVAAAQAETQKALETASDLRKELEALQNENNKLRTQVALINQSL